MCVGVSLAHTRRRGLESLDCVALARAGRSEEARAEAARLIELAKQRYVPAYDIASVYAAAGNPDRAFEWLDRAFDERSSLLATIRVGPAMDRLRSDRRYHEVERRLNLPSREMPSAFNTATEQGTSGQSTQAPWVVGAERRSACGATGGAASVL